MPFGFLSSIISPFVAADQSARNNKANIAMQQETNKNNLLIARETNALNKQIADDNLKFQRENYDYQKALQQKIFEREDTALQRQVADYRAAGLSPILAAGGQGANAGEAVATQPLNDNMQYQSGAPMQAPYSESFDISPFAQQISNAFLAYSAGERERSMQERQLQFEQQRVDLEDKREQLDEARYKLDEARFEASKQSSEDAHRESVQRLKNAQAEYEKIQHELEDMRYELKYKQSRGYSSGSSDHVKDVRETLFGALDLGQKASAKQQQNSKDYEYGKDMVAEVLNAQKNNPHQAMSMILELYKGAKGYEKKAYKEAYNALVDQQAVKGNKKYKKLR